MKYTYIPTKNGYQKMVVIKGQMGLVLGRVGA
jgi:hypothetical protein